MAAHQDVQSKVQQEIDSVIGQDRKATFADKINMPYTEAVLAETHRYSSLISLNLPHM